MSYQASATLVLGFEISRSAFPEIVERGCQHPEVEGARFCPVCGKPMWEAGDGNYIGDRVNRAFRHPVFKSFIPNTKDYDHGDNTLNPIIGQTISQASFVPDPVKLAQVESQLRAVLAQQNIPINLPFAVHLVRIGG